MSRAYYIAVGIVAGLTAAAFIVSMATLYSVAQVTP